MSESVFLGSLTSLNEAKNQNRQQILFQAIAGKVRIVPAPFEVTPPRMAEIFAVWYINVPNKYTQTIAVSNYCVMPRLNINNNPAQDKNRVQTVDSWRILTNVRLRHWIRLKILVEVLL